MFQVIPLQLIYLHFQTIQFLFYYQARKNVMKIKNFKQRIILKVGFDIFEFAVTWIQNSLGYKTPYR